MTCVGSPTVHISNWTGGHSLVEIDKSSSYTYIYIYKRDIQR